MLKNKIYRTLLYSCGVFIVIFTYYVLTSNGLGNKPFYLQFRRFIPMSIIFVITITLLKRMVKPCFFTSFAITSVLWFFTYPVFHKITFGKTVPFFSNHFDIVFAIYSFIGLTSLSIFLLSKGFKKSIIAILSILQTLLIILPMVEIAYYFYYGNCITEAAVLSVYQTNPGEAKEYILQTLGYGGVLLTILTILACSLLFYRLNGKGFADINQETLGKKTLAFFCIAGFAGTIYSFGNSFPQTGIMTLNNNVKNYFYAINQFNIDHQKTLQDLKITPPDKQFANPSTIIMVIGECASRNFMSAYTKTPADTTPWLRNQRANPEFIIFDNAYSTRVNTVMALERALTEKNQYNKKEFRESATIIDIAKGAGYYTTWFSNQGTTDESDTPITIVAKTADVSKWTNQDLNTLQYDGTLLKYLKEVDPQKNNFIVLHFMGSHDNYQNRYPEEFAKWGDPSKNEPPLNYDNSLYYSDYVLSEIYKYAKDNLNLQAMLYFSDHGTVPSGRRNPDMNPFAALRIPMFLYLSPEYRSLYPETTKALTAHQKAYYTNDLTYELICGLLNVQSNRYDETQSFASDKYKYTRETLRTNLGQTKLTDDKEE